LESPTARAAWRIVVSVDSEAPNYRHRFQSSNRASSGYATHLGQRIAVAQVREASRAITTLCCIEFGRADEIEKRNTI
jgi:hypothetical protein